MVEFNPSVSQNAQPIQGANVVENTSTASTKLEAGLKAKLHTPAQVKVRQESTPLIKADVAKFVKIASGLALIGAGVLALGALSPIVLPLGFLGAAAGYTAAKVVQELQGKQKNVENTQTLAGALVIGASIGTLGCGALVLAGVLMIRGETKKSEAPAGAKVRANIVNNSAGEKITESEFKTHISQLISNRGYNKIDEAVFNDGKISIQKDLNQAINNKEISKEVGKNLFIQLSLNKTECTFHAKIENFRTEIRKEMHDLGEISGRKETYTNSLKTSLDNKEIAKEFYKSALKELEKFSEDHEIGKEYYPKRLESSFPYLIDRTNREIEFYTFSESLRNTTPNNSITDNITLLETIKENQVKAKLTLEDKNIPNIAKDNFMASNSGNSLLRGEMVATTITDIATTLAIGKTELEKNEIVKNLKIMDLHLKHELNDKFGKPITPPTAEEVKNAYDKLRKYSKGTEALAPKTAMNQESGVDKEINRLMDEVNEGMDDETFAKLAEYAPKTEPSTAQKTEASTVKNDPAAALFDEIDKMTGAKLDKVFDNLPKLEPEIAPKAAPKTETTTVKNDPAADLFAEMEDMIKAARRGSPGNTIKG